MSLLINESYANTAQPLWVGANGGTIDGTLTANEVVTGRLETTRQIGIGSHAFSDANGVVQAGILITGPGTTAPPANDLMIGVNPGQKLRLNQAGNDGTNTTFTPSAAGANLDSLVVGGAVSTRQLKMLDTGANAVAGSSNLTAGLSLPIATTACLGPSSHIFITRTGVNASTAVGELRVQTKNVGNFIVVSATPGAPATTETGDVSSFDWVIINPA